MLSIGYIEGFICERIEDERLRDAAYNVLLELYKDHNTYSYLRIRELAVLSNHNLTSNEAFDLGIILTSLPVPIFKLTIEFHPNSNDSTFLSNDLLLEIINHEPISNPYSGEELAYDEYINMMSFIFQVNNELFLK